MRSLSSLLALGVVLIASGCYAPRFMPPGALVTDSQRVAICDDLTKGQQTPSSLRALVDATVSRAGEAASLRYAILSRNPDRLRIDLLPPEGAYTLGILTLQEGRAVLLDAQEKRYSIAPDAGELLESFFGLRGITREIIVSLLSGTLPPLECSSVRVYQGANGRVSLLDLRSHVVWEVDQGSGAVDGCTILDDSDRVIHLSGRRERGGGDRGRDSRPAKITLSLFKPVEASVEMVLTRLVFNPTLSEELFNVAIPPSYRER